MRWIVRATCAALVVLVFAVATAVPMYGQGVTTAALRGSVVDDAGAPIESAVITLVNTSTGQRFRGVSRLDGRYNIENVPAGGPYTLESRRIGYQRATSTEFTLTIGQALEVDLIMTSAAVALDAVIVTPEEQDPATAISRTGTVGFVSEDLVRRLPTLNRNFTDFIATVPQVADVGGDAPSMGGGHNRMNNIQIDGVSDNDLFGLGATGQPGGQVGAKSITLEAVKEYQVLIAPYDVRQSGFHGGLVNAVTRGGTNRWSGSAFWYFQDDDLVQDLLPANEVRFGDYRQHQRGFSLGGPILRDRLHFFAAAEWQARSTPNRGLTIGRDDPSEVQIAPDSAQRLESILSATYSVESGSFREITLATPNRNIFGRIDFQINDNHTLTARHNYVDASSDLGISHSPFSYEFTSNAYVIDNTTHSTVLQLNSTLGGGKFFNELRVGYLRIRDRRDPNVPYAALEVDNDSDIGGQTFGNRLKVGAERFSQRNRLNQDVWELTDDLTFAKGRHTFTVGTHNERISFDNTFFHTSIGRWRFNSLADLEAATPREYFVQIPFPGVTDQTTAGRADWSVLQLGFYLQDRWEIKPNMWITGGLRVDIPIVNDDPKRNDDVAAAFGIETNVIPSGNIHFAPRLGFNWDVKSDRTTVVRGGAGIFTGRPAYVWMSNAFTNTGKDIVTVTCRAADGIPAFNSTTMVDPPQDCTLVSGVSVPRSQINFFDSSFKFPQQLKLTAAIDQRLPFGVIGTVEFLYNKAINSIYQEEMNIPESALRTNAEGRELFGDPSGGLVSGNIPPSRVDPNFAHILRHTNRSDDWSYSLTFQLQRRFRGRYQFNAGYTYAKVKDLTSLGSSIASSNFGFSPVSQGGNPNNKEVTNSRFDVPHRITISGAVDVPIPNLPSTFSLIYVGQSGTPFSWTISGDANGDGYRAPEIGSRHNDMAYVPSGASDFTPDNADPTTGDFARYDALIGLMDCMSGARGSIPERNTCRNPWRNRLDANARIYLGGRGQNLSLVVDAFNVLNFIDADWGIQRVISFFETRTLLQLRDYDNANDRGEYRYIGPNVLTAAGGDPENLETVDDLRSRWRLQIGIRYDF